jgi:hypothetical protein
MEGDELSEDERRSFFKALTGSSRLPEERARIRGAVGVIVLIVVFAGLDVWCLTTLDLGSLGSAGGSKFVGLVLGGEVCAIIGAYKGLSSVRG